MRGRKTSAAAEEDGADAGTAGRERRPRRTYAPKLLEVEEAVLRHAKKEAEKAGGGEEAAKFVVYDLLVRTFEVCTPDPGRKGVVEPKAEGS